MRSAGIAFCFGPFYKWRAHFAIGFRPAPPCRPSRSFSSTNRITELPSRRFWIEIFLNLYVFFYFYFNLNSVPAVWKRVFSHFPSIGPCGRAFQVGALFLAFAATLAGIFFFLKSIRTHL